MMKKVLNLPLISALLLISMLFVANSAKAVDQTNPYILMDQAASQLFNDIKAAQSKIATDPNYMRTIVQNDLMPYVQVKYAGSLVLGSYFSSTTPEQRSAYFDAFGKFIDQSYAQVLTLYNNQKIVIEKPQSLGQRNIVSIRVTVIQNGGVAPVKLDFKWRKNSKTGFWQVYDMAAEGVSMVATKRDEWSQILRTEGIDALTAQINKLAAQPIVIEK